ncbi:hypothetical protein A2J03_20865 [Rhodococcus sp. EPR-157]|jgi:hypothetical protein|nr:hypothetical protein A2J03_20865 [Rhodococcus sp. EPR-157]
MIKDVATRIAETPVGVIVTAVSASVVVTSLLVGKTLVDEFADRITRRRRARDQRTINTADSA